MKKLFSILLILFFIFFGCTTIPQKSLHSQQSYVIDLTFECEDGKQESCDKLKEEIKILKSMLDS